MGLYILYMGWLLVITGISDHTCWSLKKPQAVLQPCSLEGAILVTFMDSTQGDAGVSVEGWYRWGSKWFHTTFLKCHWMMQCCVNPLWDENGCMKNLGTIMNKYINPVLVCISAFCGISGYPWISHDHPWSIRITGGLGMVWAPKCQASGVSAGLGSPPRVWSCKKLPWLDERKRAHRPGLAF